MDATPITDSLQAEAFRKAVELAGGQERFAELIGYTQSTVSRRLRAGMPLWAESVLQVEAATGVSRHELRPDIYPLDPPPLRNGQTARDGKSAPANVLPAGAGDTLEGLRT
jgi:DNA-binding transcriptional regulator YdaS (Cro superfamily)